MCIGQCGDGARALLGNMHTSIGALRSIRKMASMTGNSRALLSLGNGFAVLSLDLAKVIMYLKCSSHVLMFLNLDVMFLFRSFKDFLYSACVVVEVAKALRWNVCM